ncbi:MAG: Sulfate/thiosulfate import ATP-binding protein CysA [Alphaproteobacteria bacterium MarineAlpha5_Bin11]|nr:putative 2-aminoethylphosphonate ABC transporter ATP-binding protein [Pelagibacteraceae bacterium]PPR42693.1 MAG: Sulfate/thiosulfate import ATP-binding protein CysA [Alphaproteobacteria bacterium MarineAlpha5_Bin11]PPR52100.1 MAG: Sulfate/thiosulfate import ATP-binding protein CysA [Alphaproteobacteria bacterium MarineAlpha5_Bin10]|tara:strand:+ start:3050 stop:4126 length:1077 start_codon:yes stop_codon:yes gene_type:complete
MGSISNSYLETKNLSKSFGSFQAIKDISISIKEGEFVCFLGPSGCGKTTLLRCIAGLEIQSAGMVFQKDLDISNLPPSNRDFGIVFQSYALFPNLNVFSNISYGLINNKWKKDDVKRRVDELLELVNLTDHAKKYPSQLSGGEQQRVALSRALATSPGLLLLDEPLSALDAKVRVFLRKQIRDLQRKLGVTTIMVTHDQEEAQTMADRIFVMKDGEIIQSGTPNEIYTKANSPFIASFIGSMNFFPAVISNSNQVRCNNVEIYCDTADFKKDDSVQIAIRPEDIQLKKENSDDNILPAKIRDIEFLGSFQRVYFESNNITKDLIIVDVPSVNARKIKLMPNQEMDLYFSREDIRVYPG